MALRVLTTTMKDDRDSGNISQREVSDLSTLYTEIANEASNFVRNNPDGRFQVKIDAEIDGEWVFGDWVEFRHNGKWLKLPCGLLR